MATTAAAREVPTEAVNRECCGGKIDVASTGLHPHNLLLLLPPRAPTTCCFAWWQLREVIGLAPNELPPLPDGYDAMPLLHGAL